MKEKIRIGISACLMGEKVRYDGGHKHDRYITDTLGKFFHFVPVCPEVECGLPVPREAMHLEGDPCSPRLVTIRSGSDLTEKMQLYCSTKVEELEKEPLSGFIFKARSPSSGLFRVKVYGKGMPSKSGRGLFAASVTDRFPRLPVEEEGRLGDPGLRENFLERVFTFHRWQEFRNSAPSLGEIVSFHTSHKLMVMAHSVEIYREMGRLVATVGKGDHEKFLERYEELLMKAMAMHATARKNVNVLQHIMGYFKKDLSRWEKQELLETIERYRLGLIPLLVPLTLLKHYILKYGQEWLKGQVYLDPHPAELMLRSSP